MLGQLMWFKRFCDGAQIEFDFAVDLDDGSRNRHQQDLHTLFFSEQVRDNLSRSFDERINLRVFWERAVRGDISPSDAILVDSAIGDTPWANNAWHLHAFQLHCLRNGYLSDAFPYWAVPLDRWTQHGQLAQSENQRTIRGSSNHCLIHVRIGDCAIIYKADLTGARFETFRQPVFTAKRFFSDEEFMLLRFGLHADFSPRFYAERGARLVKADTYAKAARALAARLDEPVDFTLATDGYTTVATALADKLCLPSDDVEEELNQLLKPLDAFCKDRLVGEKNELLKPTLEKLLESSWLLTGPSLFAFTVKYALMGEPVRDQWLCLDETDTLSRYLQLPAIVDMPLSVFEARLAKLQLEEA